MATEPLRTIRVNGKRLDVRGITMGGWNIELVSAQGGRYHIQPHRDGWCLFAPGGKDAAIITRLVQLDPPPPEPPLTTRQRECADKVRAALGEHVPIRFDDVGEIVVTVAMLTASWGRAYRRTLRQAPYLCGHCRATWRRCAVLGWCFVPCRPCTEAGKRRTREAERRAGKPVDDGEPADQWKDCGPGVWDCYDRPGPNGAEAAGELNRG